MCSRISFPWRDSGASWRLRGRVRIPARNFPKLRCGQHDNEISRVVLIVEHDELLKSLTADIMEDAGFATLQAGDADEALTTLEFRSDIALMLTSVAMPGSVDGLGLARIVCKRWPAIKTIIASSQVRLIGSDLTAGSRFFLKPYHAPTMISEIHSLIGP